MTDDTLKILSKLSVLIVEDDDMALELLIGGLKPYCGAVYGANDGYSGLECFSKVSPDVVMTDIHMPDMNGFEMMKRILALKPHQKIIVFTSNDTDTNLLKSVEQGAALFLKKPIDIKELRSMIIALTYESDEQMIKISNEISIRLKNEKIYKNGDEIYLTFLQNKLFWLLAYNLNKLVTYEMIEEFVYENESVSKSAIHNAVMRLKKELGVKFKNVSESGYILISS
ncbi:response regulator transcription factor [Campylobacter sp. faydin G-24]|uniref:Response regulator transcription factor n=1 Tax=Campylobacter anatolicus TaxID=2829105 RepID=A0ABS5HL41_9BACT|nr:response regulator transcription factor [Campylobacter anatolicus]MBR8461950.1 response regulator transcription factor [Campylobacter anatolicus]MBR8464347.1 response regulator transcription factor [Campylobacter anatolicus]